MPEAGSGSSRTIVRRAFVATVLIAVVAGSAVFVDRITVPRADATVPVPVLRSGAWFCPHGGGNGWRLVLSVTNPGSAPVPIRVTTFGKEGPGEPRRIVVPRASDVRVPVDGGSRGASTEVEYFGGWVGVTAVVSEGTGAGQRAAAERCLAGPEPTWYLVDQATSLGETAYLVAMNPFAEVA